MKIALSVSEKEKARRAASPYYQALVAVGVQPGELELVSASDAAHLKAEHFDGILFAGGEDVDPSFYGELKPDETVHANRARDQFEFALLDRALHHRLPVLGICRGVQMINVKFGGTLYQDLKAAGKQEHQQTAPRPDATHSITVTDPESELAGVVEGSCRVNSLHHQAIKVLGRGLKRTAYSEDGLVEAVESADDYPFLMAVQWHPEEMVGQPEQRKIFEEFVDKCRRTAERR
jgi:putative glutamine amidotransferase